MDGRPSLERLRLQCNDTSFGLASPAGADASRRSGDSGAPVGWRIGTVQLTRKTSPD